MLPLFAGALFFLFPHKITHLYGVGVVHANVTEIIDQKGRITLNTNEENSTIEDVTIDPQEEYINTVEVVERGNIFAS